MIACCPPLCSPVSSYLGHVYTPDTSNPKCQEPLYSPWPFGPVHTPAPWAFPSSHPPQYVPPSSKSNRPPLTPWAWATVVPEAAAPAAAAMAAVTWLWVRVAKPSLPSCYTYMSNGTSTAYWPPGRPAAPPEYTVSVRGRGLTSAEAGSHPDLTMLSQPAFLAQREAGVPSRHSRVQEEGEDASSSPARGRRRRWRVHLPGERRRPSSSPAVLWALPTAHCPLPTAQPTLATAYTPLLQLPSPSHNSSQKSHISQNCPPTEKAVAGMNA